MSSIQALRVFERLLVSGLVAPDNAQIVRLPSGVHNLQYRGKEKSSNGKRIEYLGLEDSVEHKKWTGAIARRNELKQLRIAIRSLEAYEKAVAKALLQTSEDSNEWYTPPSFLAQARAVMSAIDLDPASNPLAQQWVKANFYYTKYDNGLTSPWCGRVWCNPPYGNYTKQFLAKGVEEYQAGNITQAIFLINRSGAGWFKNIKGRFSAHCEVFERIKFVDRFGVPSTSPRYNNDFLYLGTNIEKFKEVFGAIGEMR